MGRNAKTTEFLKECLADALIKLMQEKPYPKITINEICKTAGVSRSTWFRSFSGKDEAITYKLVCLWDRWVEEHGMQGRPKIDSANRRDFLEFTYANRTVFEAIGKAPLNSCIYDAFCQVMMPEDSSDPMEFYVGCFYTYALFGLQVEWIGRGFRETPEQMLEVFDAVARKI